MQVEGLSRAWRADRLAVEKAKDVGVFRATFKVRGRPARMMS